MDCKTVDQLLSPMTKAQPKVMIAPKKSTMRAAQPFGVLGESVDLDDVQIPPMMSSTIPIPKITYNIRTSKEQTLWTYIL